MKYKLKTTCWLCGENVIYDDAEEIMFCNCRVLDDLREYDLEQLKKEALDISEN